MTLISDDLEEWEEFGLKGDFSRIPQPFLWKDSARFAHFLNGYEEAGGFDELANLEGSMSDTERETGRWRGSAHELWMCLFFKHRTARHTGSYDADPALDALAESLSTALRRLPTGEALTLAGRLKGA